MAPQSGQILHNKNGDARNGPAEVSEPLMVEIAPKSENKGPPIWRSVRLQVAVVMLLSNGISMSLRTSFSVTVVCMVNHSALDVQDFGLDLNFSGIATNVTQDGCQGSSLAQEEKKEDGPFVWDKKTQGLVLSALYWSYATLLIPGSWLTTRMGGRLAVGVGMAGASLCTLLIPLFAPFSPWWVAALRAGAGGIQVLVYPALLGGLVTQWSPPRERELFVGFSLSGQFLFNALCLPLAAQLCKTEALGGWAGVFYVQGALNAAVTVAWFLVVSDSPARHPWISQEEKAFIADSMGMVLPSKERAMPWRSVLTSLPILAITTARVAFNWGYFLTMTTLPLYMQEVLKVDIASNGLLSMLPYLVMVVMLGLASVTSRLLISHRVFSVLAVRKMLTFLGLGVPAALVLGLSYIDCGQTVLAVVLLCAGVGLLGVNYSGYLINILDVAPAHATTVGAATNCIACMNGILAPYVVALLTPDRTREQWQTVFFLTCAVFAVGTATFLVFAQASVQKWDREDEDPIELTCPPPDNKVSS